MCRWPRAPTDPKDEIIPRIRDTIPAFDAFARKAGLESPMRREQLWTELYWTGQRDVFDGLDRAVPRSTSGVPALARDLSRVRARVKEATPVMGEIIDAVDPAMAELLGLPAEPSPLHVLMVGAFTTNAAVGRLGDDVAVFHCLEWFQSPEGAQALVAHETAHAWHQLALRRAGLEAPPEDDLAWTIFSEGMATQASRVAVPALREVDYFWYGHQEVEDWVRWCDEHASELRTHIAAVVDIPEAVETFFGSGRVDGRWRVGYHIADRLVAGLGATLPELVALSVDQAREAVLDALATGDRSPG